MSTEFPVATKHRHDMAEKLLKVTLNQDNKKKRNSGAFSCLIIFMLAYLLLSVILLKTCNFFINSVSI